ncbi:hypothetical protein ACFOHK_18775 [Falsigemmobacter intermedius]|uniref:hypothetical protein n=1 Tax=Falsigemmobacter intermedius TaxID=1553448 RepID=UPI001F4F4669|nr:hypothetical protein [Falsigemmobacter intermedius]
MASTGMVLTKTAMGKKAALCGARMHESHGQQDRDSVPGDKAEHAFIEGGPEVRRQQRPLIDENHRHVRGRGGDEGRHFEKPHAKLPGQQKAKSRADRQGGLHKALTAQGCELRIGGRCRGAVNSGHQHCSRMSRSREA